MTLHVWLADLVTGGLYSEKQGLLDDAMGVLEKQELYINKVFSEFMAMSRDFIKRGVVIADQERTIHAQRQALDQIAAELSELIYAAGPNLERDLRAIRALTKGPH